MFRTTLVALSSSALLLGGCASQNPYDQSAPSSNRAATYGGIGALVGAAAGALINHDNRGKGALIGAAAAGYGYYADKLGRRTAPQHAGNRRGGAAPGRRDPAGHARRKSLSLPTPHR